MQPYSIELRERAVNAYLSNAGTYAYVAWIFKISSSSIKRWVSLKRSTGSVETAPRQNGPDPIIDKKGLKKIKQILDKKSDLTLPELQ